MELLSCAVSQQDTLKTQGRVFVYKIGMVDPCGVEERRVRGKYNVRPEKRIKECESDVYQCPVVVVVLIVLAPGKFTMGSSTSSSRVAGVTGK